MKNKKYTPKKRMMILPEDVIVISNQRFFEEFGIEPDDKFIGAMTRFSSDKRNSNNVAFLKADPLPWLYKQLEGLKDSRPTLMELELKAREKWVGPQGGSNSWETMAPLFEAYYAPPTKITYQPTQRLKNVLRKITPPCTRTHWTSVRLWNEVLGDHKSNSGFEDYGDRRAVTIRRNAIRKAAKGLMLPETAGSRFQKGKPRCIFNSPLASQYLQVKYSKDWLYSGMKECQWVAWKSFEDTWAYLSKFIRSHREVVALEADYETFDHWIWEHTWVWLNDLYEEIKGGKVDQDFIHLLFTNTLLTPEGAVQGPHALFSGIFPTNSLECHYNMPILLSFMQEYFPDLIYGVDYVIVVQGDDSIILMDGQKVSQLEADLPDLFARWSWEKFGVKANPLKQRVSRKGFIFCKHASDFSKPINTGSWAPIYPLTLAFNNIWNPENPPSGAMDFRAYSLIRAWQVLDQSKHHPLWKASVLYLRSLAQFSVPAEDLEAAIANYNTLGHWRLKVFGEKFSIESSPTARLWLFG